MKFSGRRFLTAFVVAVVVALTALAAFRALGVLGGGRSPSDPEELARIADENLDAVRRRQPGERRPASYDSVLRPLDDLLRQIRDIMQNPEYDPEADFEKVRSRAVPVIDIAARADQQARNETGFLTKNYRFNEQRAEASRFLAAAMWERLQARRSSQSGFLAESRPFSPSELIGIRRIIEDGLSANPENRDLLYMRGVIYREEGLFAAAARDLEKAVELDPSFASGWNTLALVRISLKEFDKAEEAYERAKALALEHARVNNREPGPEYVSILYNLAMFHDGLASFYARENRVSPTVENQRLAVRHTDAARRYFQEFLAREPAGSPDAQLARSRLSALQ